MTDLLLPFGLKKTALKNWLKNSVEKTS